MEPSPNGNSPTPSRLGDPLEACSETLVPNPLLKRKRNLPLGPRTFREVSTYGGGGRISPQQAAHVLLDLRQERVDNARLHMAYHADCFLEGLVEYIGLPDMPATSSRPARLTTQQLENKLRCQKRKRDEADEAFRNLGHARDCAFGGRCTLEWP